METSLSFNGECPFCGGTANDEMENMLSLSCRCSCGAIALGAPSCDFDEVIDDARNYFGLTVDGRTINFRHHSEWLNECGVSFLEGGVGGPSGPRRALGSNHYYWFKLVESD